MKSKIIFSIIIPAFNAENYIERCLASVYYDGVNEDLFEVIVINDGSKDKTAELVKDYSITHNNILLVCKNNEGVSIARNKGINIAKGDYILLLDADDELIAGSFKKVCKYLAEIKPIDMLVTRQVRNNGEREWLVREPPLKEHQRYDGVEAYRKCFIRTNAGGGICRKEFLNENGLKFPAGVRNAEDTIFFGQLQVYAKSIVYYNVPLYLIHETAGSASRPLDYTKLGLSHVVTMRSVAEIKKNINVNINKEYRAIFDFVVYQLLANTIAYFVMSKELKYSDLCKMIPINDLLPLDIKNMYIWRNKARLMNFSFSLFYLLSKVKHLYR